MSRQVRPYPKPPKDPSVPKGHKGPEAVSPPSQHRQHGDWYQPFFGPDGRPVGPPSGRAYSPFLQDSGLGTGPAATDSQRFGLRHGSRQVYVCAEPSRAFPIEVQISVWNDPFGAKLWCIYVPDLGSYTFLPYWDPEGSVTRPQ